MLTAQTKSYNTRPPWIGGIAQLGRTYGADVSISLPTTPVVEELQAGVHVENPNFSPPRMLFVISSQRVNIWYHTDPHDHWKRVTWPVFFSGLGLSLEAKLVSTKDRPSIFQFYSGFSKRGRKIKLRRILHDPVGRTPRHVCRKIRAKNRRSLICLDVQH